MISLRPGSLPKLGSSQLHLPEMSSPLHVSCSWDFWATSLPSGRPGLTLLSDTIQTRMDSTPKILRDVALFAKTFKLMYYHHWFWSIKSGVSIKSSLLRLGYAHFARPSKMRPRTFYFFPTAALGLALKTTHLQTTFITSSSIRHFFSFRELLLNILLELSGYNTHTFT